MFNDEFAKFLDLEMGKILSIRTNAHQEYAGKDVFENFNRRANELNINRNQAWAVLAFKHVDTIKKFCAGTPGVENREAIENRIRDAILYLFLLLGMVTEDRLPVADNMMTLHEQVRSRNAERVSFTKT
jgi:hypothetical protein